MQALLFTGPRRIELTDVADPQPGNDEALVEIQAAGICGSDIHAYLGHDERRPPPLVLGHEAAGRVLTGSHAGRLVAINPLVACATCRTCLSGRTNLCAARQFISIPPRHGTFARLVAVPDANLVPLPDDFDPAKGALAEPLACGWHAVVRAEQTLARPLAAAQTVVLGGGTIGLGAALVLAARGTGAVALGEPRGDRRERLQGLGAFHVFDPTAAATAPAGVDLVVDAYGDARSREAACAMVRPGGTIVHLGLAAATGGIDVRRLTLSDVSFLGSFTYTAVDFAETVDAMVAGRLGALDWVEQRAFADGDAAFADVAAGRTAAPKLMLRP